MSVPNKGCTLFRGLSMGKGGIIVPKFQGKTAQRSANNAMQIKVDEDFSLMTAGTEDTPDDAMICDNLWNIPDTYFHQPGWTGMGVQQAGGTCALAYPNYGGVINTPIGDYSGTISISFRTKALDNNNNDNVRLSVGLCYDIKSASILTYKTVTAKKGEWTDYSITFECDYGGEDAFVQFNCYDYIVLDDVKVEKDQSILAEPVLKSATDFTYDGFTANWGSVGGATDYLLTVYKKTAQSDDDMAFDEDFSTVATGLPEGWTMTRGDDTTDLLYSDEQSGISDAIKIANGDTICMPDNGGTLLSLEFDVIEGNIPFDEYGAKGTIILEGWDGYRWNNEGYIFASNFNLEDDNKVHHIIKTNDVAGNYSSLRFRVEKLDEGAFFAIDNFKWETTAPTVHDYLFEDKVVEETSYTLTDLDPEADYYYTVRAHNAETGVVSLGPTQCMDAFGVAKPYLKEATEVDARGGYTANWEPAPKATSYLISNYDVYTATETITDHVVLIEDFSALDGNGYTPQEPYAFNNTTMESLDEFTDYSGWYGFLSGVADGAIGAVGVPEFGIAGQLQSPELTLCNNGGTFHIKVSACGMYEGEVLYIYTAKGMKGIACDLLTDYQTFEADIEDGEMDDILVFETEYNTPFFITDIEVTQTLNEGDKVYTLIEEAREEGNQASSHRFSGLSREECHTYAYAVNSIYKRYFDTVWSERTERMEVDLNESAGINDATITTDYDQHAEIFYTIDGSRISQPAKGINIVRGADGKYRKMVKF
ncbi:MAG: hypothetical protein ACI304_05850 [Lepagella sp.]